MFGDHIMKLNVKNVLNFLNIDTHVDKRGYMYKKGEVNKGWQRRWFLLKGNLLFYYQNPHDSEPIGLIVLEGCSINTCSTDNTTFSITFQSDGSRTYYLCADDDETCSTWINALQRSSYGYLRAQVERLHEQVIALEKKKDMYVDHVLSQNVETDGSEASSSNRSNSLNIVRNTSPSPGVKSPKLKHGLRAFSSPLTLRKKGYSMDAKRSPLRHRKNKDPNLPSSTSRTFAQFHVDFAPGQQVNVEVPTHIRYNMLQSEDATRASNHEPDKRVAWYITT